MSHYDRVKAVQGFLQRINGIQVCEDEPRDLALLVCGCPAQCTQFPKPPQPKIGSFVLSSLEDFNELAHKIVGDSATPLF